MSLLIFILVLSVLILVHEWGHYITARRCGVKVEQFALGFGPKLFGWHRDGTEFMLCAIPLGGFVKMAGDDRGQVKGEAHEYFAKSVGQRALIVVMGPVVNFVFAFLCFWVVFMIGFVDMEATAKKVPAIVGQVVEQSPAQKAGIQAGDVIVAIAGHKVEHWPDIQEQIMATKESPLLVDIVRNQQSIALAVDPGEQSQTDIFGRKHVVRRIGIGPKADANGQEMVVVRYGPLGAFAKAGQQLWAVTTKTYQSLYEMVIGVRSRKEVMGIFGMFFVVKYAVSVGVSYVLNILGVISASLAIFNLLPIIPLDGGHLLLLAIEKIRGKMLSLKTEMLINQAGIGFILILALSVFYVDFERIGLIDKIHGFFVKPTP